MRMTDKPVDPQEVQLLLRLEHVDRQLKQVADEKAEAMAQFNEQRKGLEATRDTLLNDLDQYRLGNRGLPLE
jgi:hypothetical protein